MGGDVTQNSEPIAVELDISDLDELRPPEAVKPLATPFSASIEKAANSIRKTLAASESRVAAAEIKAGLSDTADQMFGSAQANNARLAGFGVNVNVNVFRKAPKGFYKEPGLLVRSWLELPQKLGVRTAKQIVADLQERYHPHLVRKEFMSKRLHPRQSKHLRAMLGRAGVPLKLADCNTLSKVQMHLQNHYNPPEYEEFKTTIKLAKDGSHVLWNGKHYSVFLNGDVPTIKRSDKRIAVSAIKRILG